MLTLRDFRLLGALVEGLRCSFCGCSDCTRRRSARHIFLVRHCMQTQVHTGMRSSGHIQYPSLRASTKLCLGCKARPYVFAPEARGWAKPIPLGESPLLLGWSIFSALVVHAALFDVRKVFHIISWTISNADLRSRLVRAIKGDEGNPLIHSRLANKLLLISSHQS